MTEEPPVKEAQEAPRQNPVEPDGGGEGIAARHERGEIDMFTIVSVLPESAIPPALRATYLTAKRAVEAPEIQAIADNQKREQRSRDHLQQLGLWRLQRGEGYVQAYTQFQQTGKAVEAGKAVFESVWFRELQARREREIAELEEKQRAGTITKSEQDRLGQIQGAYEGDKKVSENWKSLQDEYQKLKDRENAGGMDENELREKEAELKQRLYEQLDKASPELREQLLQQIAASDPKFREEYEASSKTRQQNPESASNLDTLQKAGNFEQTSTAEGRELIADFLEDSEPARSASAAQDQGFDGVKTNVNMRGSFITATVAAPVIEQEKPEPSIAPSAPANSSPQV